MRLIFLFVIGITQIFALPQGYEFGSPFTFEENHVDEASVNDSPLEVNIEDIHADAVMEEEKPSLSDGVWSSPLQVDDLSSLHADAVMEAKNNEKNPRLFESPVELDDLNNLHADAVMEAKKKVSPGKKWFEAIDAKTLDKVITEMNEMNRWFAKVVKYWDDFTSGGTGEEVLKETGMGIEEPDAVDAKNEEENTPEGEGVEETPDEEVVGEEDPPEEDVKDEAPSKDVVGDELPEEDPEDADIEEGALDPVEEEQEQELPEEVDELPEEEIDDEAETPTEEEIPEAEEEATEGSRRRRLRRRRRM